MRVSFLCFFLFSFPIPVRFGTVCLLGVDISIEKAMEASDTMLVGRVRGRKYSADYITDWAQSAWKESPGLPVEITILVRGWFSITFDRKVQVDWVLERNWFFGKRPILFKRWTPLFDAQKEKMGESPVWVKLPGLPLQFWTDSVFVSIGNTLGTFLEADKSYIQTKDRSVARILVSLNPREGLADAMTLHYRDLEFLQTLDYEHLPFRCNRCHECGHLAKECPLGHRRRRRQKKQCKKEKVTLSDPDDIPHEAATRPTVQEAPPSSEENVAQDQAAEAAPLFSPLKDLADSLVPLQVA